ncbi:MAG: hypothetical protein KBT34_10500 [Prevotella sp.]|nr:hypothetical protein [Candidatus Prevotella equi]
MSIREFANYIGGDIASVYDAGINPSKDIYVITLPFAPSEGIKTACSIHGYYVYKKQKHIINDIFRCAWYVQHTNEGEIEESSLEGLLEAVILYNIGVEAILDIVMCNKRHEAEDIIKRAQWAFDGDNLKDVCAEYTEMLKELI